jgi:hypothetical protein
VSRIGIAGDRGYCEIRGKVEGAMSVTYEEARETVRARLEPEWKWGTFCLDDRQIIESDNFWVFEIGAREALVDGDHSYLIAGGVTVVSKEDGRIGSLPSVEVALDPSMRTRPNPEPTLI